jgi:predicted HicB family RNase H-like nuclease
MATITRINRGTLSQMPRRKTAKGTWVDTHIRLPEELHARVTAKAESEFRSFNQQVIACLEQCLGSMPARPRETSEERSG